MVTSLSSNHFYPIDYDYPHIYRLLTPSSTIISILRLFLLLTEYKMADLKILNFGFLQRLFRSLADNRRVEVVSLGPEITNRYLNAIAIDGFNLKVRRFILQKNI